MSDTELTDLDGIPNELPSDMESSDSEFEYDFVEVKSSEPHHDLKYPVFAQNHRETLTRFRQICDLCMEPPAPGVLGGFYTFANANKENATRDFAESALKLYNDTKLKNFKLVKVCKFNIGDTCYGLTFRAQEDGSEECLFRGVIHCVGGAKPVFCEMKDDDEVTLLPCDDDYVRSDRSCGSKHSSPSICKKDSGDGSIAGSGVSAGTSK